ncbi:MAG: DNA polymerase III subunit delta' [Desulfobacteraceae bacterium]
MTVPGFDTIIGQKLPIRLLQTLLRNGTLPHALIFSGITGIGKRTTAKIVAMALNCTVGTDKTSPCGNCPSCRKISSNGHPDLLLIEPQRQQLRIDQIRNLLRTLSMKPYQAKHRVVIIADAQAMNKEASNALLKMLEEPPADTILILTVRETSDLLPTIVSRCRHLHFNPLPQEEIISLLSDAGEIDTLFIQTAAALSGGSLAKAMQLATKAWRDQRNWLVAAAGLGEPPRQERRPIESALAFAAQLAQKKDQIAELLEVLKTWIRDLSVWPYHPSSVINGDYNEVLATVRSGLQDRELLDMWRAVEKAQKDIAAKANLRLTLDVMALSMAGYGQD